MQGLYGGLLRPNGKKRIEFPISSEVPNSSESAELIGRAENKV